VSATSPRLRTGRGQVWVTAHSCLRRCPPDGFNIEIDKDSWYCAYYSKAAEETDPDGEGEDCGSGCQSLPILVLTGACLWCSAGQRR
jgi:hypothetical protein